MFKAMLFSAIQVLMLAKVASAVSCSTHSYTTCDDGIVHWFDPDDGMVCDPLDCGGGRAPPKTAPGCPGYTGTVVRSVSYLSCWTPSGATTTEAATATSDNTRESTTDTGRFTINTEPESTALQATKTSTQSVKESEISSTQASTKDGGDASTTSAATLSTGEVTAAINTPGSTDAPNSGNVLGDSLIVIAGAAIVAILLV